MQSALPARRTRPVRTVLNVALFGLAAAMPLWAVAQSAEPTAAATHEDTREFNIAPGPLSDVLARFAGAAGVALSFDAATLRGFESSGLRGRHTVADGFARLLGGTGIEAVHQGSGDYLLCAHGNGEAALEPVTVTAAGIPTATTEGSHTYASDAVTIGKGAQRVRDIPQSISVVTRKRIEDQNLTTVADAMRQTTGMTVVEYGTGTAEISARGFDLDSIQIDGVPITTGYGMWGVSSPDLALFDRVEVMRGPAGILQGAGEPGGAVNLVRKRARGERAVHTSVQAGTWDRYRAEVDATGALSEDGRLRARVVAAYDDRKSFIDTVYARKPLFYGTLEYDIAPATTLSTGFTTQRMTSRPDVGLPMYADGRVARLPRSTYLGSDWDKKEEEQTSWFVEAEHRFDDGGEARVRLTRLDREYTLETSAFGNSYVDPDTGDITRMAFASRDESTDTGVDAYLSRPFSALGREHRFTVGADARRYDMRSVFSDFHSGLPQNVFDPIRDLPKPDLSFGDPSEYVNTQYGLYGQLQWHLTDATQAIIGGRLSNWETDQKTNPDASYRIRNEFTPNLGIIHELTRNYSLYASYAGIFQPQNGTTADGGALDPRTGEQYEVGVKGELSGGRLTMHAALFRIDDEDRALADPDNPTFSVNAGKVRSEGFEAEIAGQINERWQAIAGYAWTKSRYVKADEAVEGSDFSSGTPEHSAKLWSTYHLSPDLSRGWSVGGGLEYSSGVYSESGGAKWKQGAYTIVSARVDYRFDKNWAVSLNAENLFDKKYFTRMAGWSRQSYYGNPRNFMLTLRGSF